MSEHIDVNEHMKKEAVLTEEDATLLEKARAAYIKLKNDLWQLDNLERKIRTDYTADLEKIRKARMNLQEACPHLETKYYPDPSGNNDSHTTCQLCKKDI